MDQRHERYRQAEQIILAHLARHPSAVSTRTLAQEMGWSWRIVARALLRLAAAGSVQRIERITHDSRCRRRVHTTYRAVPVVPLAGAFPAWLVPHVFPVAGARLVQGRAMAGA
ncbi:MAG: hypothetical protein AW09_004108 [Candidatus Accumulibacter phosphatis]|jgi:DNA-binding transcriptional MocR family regulator|uniref:Uncharacterized protein n=1 Tax=Candidatus Accumulibacter phosphatis TaxID=327160 RepID=A0A080LT57_9PROT|nr:MAG: hypothetical protein AW09_004108 [Candidatus Accumulibacter phosphatis]HRF12440.1 GntR family transcriptional regulator [Candidatus Accumulibacter phosphatis]